MRGSRWLSGDPRRAPAGTRGPDKFDVVARAHPYLTVEERFARGPVWRETAPIEGHAVYEINRRRKSPVGILQGQDDARVKELVPIRCGRMSESAFKSYGGSAAIMAYDLSGQKWTPGHTHLGTVAVMDTEPRQATQHQLGMLADLAEVVMDDLELRLSAVHALQGGRRAGVQP